MKRGQEEAMSQQPRNETQPGGAPARWQPQGFATLPELPLIGPEDVHPFLPELDVWDCWPLSHEDGRTVVHAGRQWWFFLCAPQFADPVDRHARARIRLVSRELPSRGEATWQDHGYALDPATTPGSREWAGSAVLMDDGHSVALFFTAAGRRGGDFTFEQRLFVAEGVLSEAGPGNWGVPREMVQADGIRYFSGEQREGAPGAIKGFRDPAWFRDPQTGERHILFTASDPHSSHSHDGLIGFATLRNGVWQLGNPLVDAVGVNNELERPHVLYRDGWYYLFWSTQRSVFAPGAVAGPTGLYAMAARAFAGPWVPVNGSGLVACTPASEPMQSYSWWVTGEGEVWSFVDQWGMAGRTLTDHPELRRSQFGGCPAPVFRLDFRDDRISIA